MAPRTLHLLVEDAPVRPVKDSHDHGETASSESEGEKQGEKRETETENGAPDSAPARGGRPSAARQRLQTPRLAPGPHPPPRRALPPPRERQHLRQREPLRHAVHEGGQARPGDAGRGRPRFEGTPPRPQHLQDDLPPRQELRGPIRRGRHERCSRLMSFEGTKPWPSRSGAGRGAGQVHSPGPSAWLWVQHGPQCVQ
eukprot:CAMPEP_0206221446 /NCGR_PEP_ID=MMETSP0047_2-20121206/5419_1 /ASSEMBLY_ACC=CAM_ASM_000192 /TAXON_ID=195065 /ORGANISM="Chroomonas mesostigmatica_cf, Strain CCMP1168" /LENGTH=197 /DNA_ID=CAMNT_0053644181 /DNA_START=96 /DNA_END=690 /DNA_ORIENTATION=-